MATNKTSLVSLIDDFTHRPQQNFQRLEPSADGTIKLPVRYIKNLRRSPVRRNVLTQTPTWLKTDVPVSGWMNVDTEAYGDGAGIVQQFMDFGVNHPTALLCNYLYDITNNVPVVIYDLKAWPAGAETDSHKQLLLVADDPLAFPTLGDTIEVEIDSATTFKWRFNGGSWTAGVPIARNVVIDTYYNLWFVPDALQNFDTYNIGDHWTWERHDSTNGAIENVYGYNTYVRNADVLFFIGTNGRVYRSEIGSGPLRARSVGYSPVYGSYLSIFYNHLVVGDFSQTGWTNNTLYVGWSDLSDCDMFFGTDANEADAKKLVDSRESIITGVQLYNNNLYVATLSELYRVDYVGLPLVFDFVRITQTAGGYLSIGVLGLYVAGYNNDIVIFDGTNFNRLQAPLYVAHNINGQEVSWYGTYAYETDAHVLHFDEVVSEFFIQKLPYTDRISYLNPLSETSVGYAGGDGVFYTTTAGPGDDSIAIDGPEVRTSLLCVEDPEHVVEIDSVWIDAHLGFGKTASLYYKALQTATADDGTWTLAGTYNDAQFQQKVECRFSARYFAFRLVFDTAIEGSTSFAGISAYLYGMGAKVEK